MHLIRFASVLCVLLRYFYKIIHCICVQVSSFAVMFTWCFLSMKWVYRNEIPTYNFVLMGNKDLT